MATLVCPECGTRYQDASFCPQDQTKLEPWGEDPLLGEFVGNYRITRLLGAGGMGRVYRAVHKAIGARVAVKVLAGELAHNREQVERFFAEARAVNVIRHEQIVNILDLDYLPDGRPYIVMEHLDGEPFSATIKHRHPLPLGAVVTLMQEVLDALAAAHGKGIVHRDLKPDNIFVTPAGHAKVLDFGIAKLAPEGHPMSGLTQAGSIMGTPPYMSPEQAMGRPVDHRSDLYTMGIILFEATTGRQPFQAASLYEMLRMHIEAPPPVARALRPDLPPMFEDVIMRALAKDPAQRHATAQEMSYALGYAAQALPPEAWSSLRVTGHGALATGPSSARVRSGGAATPAQHMATPAQYMMPTPASGELMAHSRSMPGVGGAPHTVASGGRGWKIMAGVLAGALAAGGIAYALTRGDATTGPAGPGGPGQNPQQQATPPVAGKPAPPRLIASYSNQGWMLNFVLTELAADVQYKLPGDAAFKSLGKQLNSVDPSTGEPLAKTFLMLDLDASKTVIQVKYQTKSGEWRGPFEVPFDPAESALREAKGLLQDMPKWIEFRWFDGKLLIYFTWLIMYKNAVTAIHYGVDSDTPTQKVKFTPSQTREIAEGDEVFKELPLDTKFVTVQVTFGDGTKSEVKTFKAPPKEP